MTPLKNFTMLQKTSFFLVDVIILAILGLYSLIALLACLIMSVGFIYCLFVAPHELIPLTLASLTLGFILRIILGLVVPKILEKEEVASE